MQVLSGLIVSVDAFFIGLSLGLQEKCRFAYLVAINAFLLVLCIMGFLVAGRIYENIPFEPDYIVGFAFIAMGIWTILCYVIAKHTAEGQRKQDRKSVKNIIIIGLVMSGEAMLITMGITFIFLPYSSFFIPVAVAFAHFGYSALSFFLARTKYVRRIPDVLSYVISGTALIIYGLMALVL